MNETYNAAQLAMLAAVAGFRGHDSDHPDKYGALDIAVAIAIAESGGKNEVGDLNRPHAGCSSTGMWQINYCPDRDKAGSLRDPANASDPWKNAQAAYSISNGGTNFHPWTTYTSGAYKAHLGDAWDGVETYKETPDGGDIHNLAAFGTVQLAKGDGADTSGPNLDLSDPSGNLGGAVAKAVDPLKAIASFFAFAGDPHNWLRVAVFIGGGTLILVGGVIMFRDEAKEAAEGAVAVAAVA